MYSEMGASVVIMKSLNGRISSTPAPTMTVVTIVETAMEIVEITSPSFVLTLVFVTSSALRDRYRRFQSAENSSVPRSRR
jgi:hypothetical protein